MGDYNYPDICLETNSAKYGPSKKFLACAADEFLLQNVEKETRGLVILDLILTNRDDVVEEVAGRGILGESNYVVLDFLISTETLL